MTDNEPLNLDAIEARYQAATPQVIKAGAFNAYREAQDAAVEDVPALIAEVRRLLEELGDRTATGDKP